MTQPELLEIVACGETSRVQFKETLDNNDSIAAEIIALANTKGGMILFGVQDKTGAVKGLTYQQIQEIGNKVASIATELIKPQEYLEKIQDDVFDLEEIDEQLCKNLNILKGGVPDPWRTALLWQKTSESTARILCQGGLVCRE